MLRVAAGIDPRSDSLHRNQSRAQTWKQRQYHVTTNGGHLNIQTERELSISTSPGSQRRKNQTKRLKPQMNKFFSFFITFFLFALSNFSIMPWPLTARYTGNQQSEPLFVCYKRIVHQYLKYKRSCLQLSEFVYRLMARTCGENSRLLGGTGTQLFDWYTRWLRQTDDDAGIHTGVH